LTHAAHTYQALTPAFLASLVVPSLIFVGATALAIVLCRMMAPLIRRRPFFADQSGLLVIQFALILPLLIMSLCSVLQTALIIHGKFVVNYAAFCAARAAAVIIPEGVTSSVTGISEAPNQINTTNSQSPKMAEIRRAAALACAGISPTLTLDLEFGPGLDLGSIPNIAQSIVMFPGSVDGNQMSAQFLQRAPYALSKTVTQVVVTSQPQTPVGSGGTPFNLVTAQVTYRYYLTVPFANRLFGTAFSGFGSSYYIEIHEQYTLPAEADYEFPEALRSIYQTTLQENYE
jgi:hypothetical protein